MIKYHALSSLSFSMLLILGGSFQAQADVVASGRMDIGHTSNGAELVNINKPSEAGVSHNIYSKFNVDNKGLILNNSTADVNSQLGGNITANSNLGEKSASIILNEVNSRDPSMLNGKLEVAGQKAQVIIANPSGITCSGCGFINANRVTLTTGKAIIENGALTGYQVNGGTINIESTGLDSRTADYTDLIARVVKVNADLRASDLEITTGLNKVDADNVNVSQLSALSSKPSVALDVSALGGMYAGKISMVGTENGVGVNNAGKIQSTSGNIVMNVNGQISNQLGGEISSAKEVRLISNASINNNKSKIYGETGVSLNGGSQSSASKILNQDGTISSKGGIYINASGMAIDNSKGTISTSALLQTRSKSLNNNGGDISGGDVDIATDKTGCSYGCNSIDNGNGNITSTGDIKDSGSLNISSYSLDNSQGKINSSGLLTVSTDANINNYKGNIDSTGDMKLNNGSYFTNDGNVTSSANMDISADGIMVNNGVINSTGDMKLSNKANFTNGGNIKSSGDVDISTDGTMTNNNSINTSKALKLSVKKIVLNKNSTIKAEGGVTFNFTK